MTPCCRKAIRHCGSASLRISFGRTTTSSMWEETSWTAFSISNFHVIDPWGDHPAAEPVHAAAAW